MRPADPSDERPHVLLVGGLLTPPLGYRRVRQRLLDRGAATVDIAPVSVIDWARAGVAGFGGLQRKLTRAILRTHARSGRPILVVGHSGGGLLARLAMSDTPYRGQVGGAAPMVGCLVTLGSPHDLQRAPIPHPHEGTRLAAFLAARQPGAYHSRVTGYVTVASDAVPAPHATRRAAHQSPLGRIQDAFFRRITGPPLAPGGDGIVSVTLAHLEGARQLTFHDVYHGVIGSPWYGDAAAIDAWWPVAVEVWREAIRRRAGADGQDAAHGDGAADGGGSE
jgi:hypothetical protein